VSVRLYVVSDLHAAEGAWRKLLNAIRLDVYKADAVLVAGDLTGKAVVPIVRGRRGYEANLLGVGRRVRSEDDLRALERDIADVGYYSFVAESDEADTLVEDDAARTALLQRLMIERMESWMALAAERLAETQVPLILIPGNDDDPAIDAILDRPGQRVVNADGRLAELPGGLELVGSGWANPTPWHTPRELPEDELETRLEALAAQVRDQRRAVYLIHVPPYDSGLDTAPILDEDLRPTISAGDVLRGPVGSTAVRRVLERHQPLLGVHGHVHESGGERRIGRTLCINPGSEANAGVLRGYLIDVGADRVDRAIRVEG
jgi:uncharacterized protein